VLRRSLFVCRLRRRKTGCIGLRDKHLRKSRVRSGTVRSAAILSGVGLATGWA
jgi:hypothetical protein